MTETILVAESGRTTGSAESRRLRRDEIIPAVVYGHGMDPLPLSVTRRDLRIALSGPAGMNTFLDLTVDGEVYPCIVKEMQRHPVRRTVAHVDFLKVNLGEAIVVAVPVRLDGEAKAVSQGGGLVDRAMELIEVETTPRNIPDEIVIDVTEMEMETVITVADVQKQLPEGVTAVPDDELPVVTVLTMSTPVLDAEEEAAEEGEEGAEGEAAEGGDAAAEDSGE